MPSQPDKKGHFGIFGGRYVAETIMPALTELEAAYRKSREGQGLPRGAPLLPPSVLGAGNAAVPGKKPHGKARRGEDLPEARRPQPHGFPQDQQHSRPGPACKAHGQASRHRRDGRRPARGGHGHRGGALRHGMPGLHGRRGHPPPGAERAENEDPRRRGGPCLRRFSHPQGRHERGHAPLGHLCSRHLLHHRLRRGPSPLPDDGPGLPERHRPRNEAADPQAGRPTARLPSSPASAAGAMPWGFSIPSATTRTSS